jgi:hypothetical protein
MLLTYNTMRNENAAQNAMNIVKKTSVYSQVGNEFLKSELLLSTTFHFAGLLI